MQRRLRARDRPTQNLRLSSIMAIGVAMWERVGQQPSTALTTMTLWNSIPLALWRVTMKRRSVIDELPQMSDSLRLLMSIIWAVNCSYSEGVVQGSIMSWLRQLMIRGRLSNFSMYFSASRYSQNSLSWFVSDDSALRRQRFRRVWRQRLAYLFRKIEMCS